MANKDSYYRKHKEKIYGTVDNQDRKPFLKASEEKRAVYEQGKVLLIDKPLHWTSFDAVRKIRNAIGIKKVGHAGTLDPLATGLLIICTGKFTKKINEYMAREKEYTGSITIGAVTPTYDLESEPEQLKDITAISLQDILNATEAFKGTIQQKPPIYSAIKKKGTPLYELARRGEEVDIQPRTITIHEFDITAFDSPKIFFRITCSTGTYIRSIANDLGAALGCGGHLSELRRTKIGEFSVDHSQSIETFLQELTG